MKQDYLRNDFKENYTYHDIIFDSEINCLVKECEMAYKNMSYQRVVKICLHDLNAAKSYYISFMEHGNGLNKQLVKKFIEVI